MEEDRIAAFKQNEDEELRQYDKRTPPCVPGVSQNQK